MGERKLLKIVNDIKSLKIQGAEAMRQAIEATLESISLTEYARDKEHSALKEALGYWCFRKPV